MPHGRALFGVDGWQALSHAMKIAKATLEVLVPLVLRDLPDQKPTPD